MRGLPGDIRFAFTTFRRAPGFAALVIMMLALGVGAATAVFSLVDAVLLRPLPYPDSQRLVRLWEEHPGGSSPAGNRWLSQLTRGAWSRHSRTIENIGAYATYDFTVRIGGDTSRMAGAVVSPRVFDLLRATPNIGRFFTADEEEAGAPRVVVLSDGLWRGRFGSNPSIAGTTLLIDGRAHIVVGVAKPELRFPDGDVSFWIPYRLPRDLDATAMIVFTALGRLRPGATVAQAEAEGTAAARSQPRPTSAAFFFGQGGPVVVHARTLAADVTARVRPALLVASAAVLLLLFIACANVANMLLSNGVARRGELAVRAALGATRARLMRQLTVEIALLSSVAGALGLVLAWWLVRVLPVAAPDHFPRLEDVTLDVRVLVFGISVSIAAALASAVAPAARSLRANLFERLRRADDPRGGTAGGTPRRLRDGLLLLEAAFAVLLMVGASLLARSFLLLTQVDAGYDTDRVLTVSVELPEDPGHPERTAALIGATLDRVRSTPGVISAGAGNMIPLSRRTAMTTVTLAPDVGVGKPASGRVLTYVVTPGFAESLGLRLRKGRFLTDADTRPGSANILVNEEFVRRFVAGRETVGRHLSRLDESETQFQIAGVIGNVLKDGNDTAPQPAIYFADGAAHRIAGHIDFVVRSSADNPTLSRAIVGYLRDADPEAALDRIAPLRRLLAASWDQPRFAASVISGFAVLAMGLAGLGLYGVLTYTISRRRREFGIRATLGATRENLVSLVVREGLLPTVAGIVVGLAAATLITRLMRRLLFGVVPLDPFSFALAPAVLMCVGLVACLVPALRAAATDPAIVLRSE